MERAQRRDPVTAAYGDVIRTARDAAAIEGPRQRLAGNALRTSPLFRQAEQVTFHNQQSLDEDGVLGRGFLVLICAARDRRAPGMDRSSQGGLSTASNQIGMLVLRYKTSVYIAKQSH